SLKLAKESAAHAETLAGLAGRAAEPWHKTGSGGFLRNVVYGFNAGMTANFGLVAGVIGADVAPHIMLVSGIAGMFADALSMGASGYLAAKSEQEVYDHEIAMEKEEIRIMPEVEEEELALVYQTKGIEAGIARKMAAEVMRDSQRALDEQVREELKIGEAHATPFKEGWLTGASTAIGAFIPVAPFLVFSGHTAAWTAFTIAMFSHFAVGAARSVFTGRGVSQRGPKLLGEMRSVGRQHDEERLDRRPARHSLLTQQVHVLHHRRDRRVVVQAFGVGGDALDRLVQLTGDLRWQPRACARGQSRGLVCRSPYFVQKTPDPDDTGLPEVAALLEGPEEHEVHPEGVCTPPLDVGVGDHHVAPRLGHLRAVLDDEPVRAELGERLLE